jgi:hypothetical protein
LWEKREDAGELDRLAIKCCFRYGKPSHFICECRSKKKAG